MTVYSLLLSLALACCCHAEAAGGSWISLNSSRLVNQSEVSLTAGSAFSLRCHGNGSSGAWSSSALKLYFLNELTNPLAVIRSSPRHTGRYTCGYTWVYVYVTDLSSVFVTPRRVPPQLEEGRDFLFRCLVTDPSVTNLTLQSEASVQAGGRGLPQGMKVTFDPQRGALISDLRKPFSGRFYCSGLRDGQVVLSNPLDLIVVSRLRVPPSVSVSVVTSVRLTGQTFEVSCLTSNPSNFYNVTWTHADTKALGDVSYSRSYSNRTWFIESRVKVTAVNHSHSGMFTCTGVNEAGAATATAWLHVLDAPYLSIYLQRANASHANASHANASHADASSNRTTENRPITVEVFEGRDVTLTFVTEAFPPISSQHWATPPHMTNSSVYQASYAANRMVTTKGYRSEASLLLRRVRHEDRGRYSFNFSNSVFSGERVIHLRVYRSPSVFFSLQNDTLTCRSSGYPLPTIHLSTCPGAQSTCGNVSTNQVSPAAVTSPDQEVSAQAVTLSPDDDVITVECVAVNQVGESRDVYTARSPAEPQLFLSSALIGSSSAAFVLLLLLLVAVYKWRQKPRYEIRWKIIESSEGNHYTFIDPSQLPYNDKWEFPRDKLRLGPVLGSGAFGKVVAATAYGLGSDDVTRVAVKMLKPSAHSEERDALMSELKILGHLGYHDNIVNLLGACTQGGPMLMITEYCCHGDLLNFLRSHADDVMASGEAFYKNMAATQTARIRSDSGISCCSDYQEMQPMGQTAVQIDRLTVGDLMRFSYQVAQGLDFLSNRNCIHRDVAARNVLLTDGGVAKICDFGLARDIRHDDSYIVQGNARLPVKWMSPESIFQCVYTVQSDVWSYGVLLWEIFSLGVSPYPNVAVDTNFYRMIKDGGHMEQPDFAPSEMYELMTVCWSLEPTDRPTFKLIGQIINRLLPSTNQTPPHHAEQTYRNIEEEEEDAVKRGEEETDRHDDPEQQPMAMNVYQLS